MSRLIFLFQDYKNFQKKDRFCFDYLSKYHYVEYLAVDVFIKGFYTGKFTLRGFYKNIKQIKILKKKLIDEKFTHLFFCLPYAKFKSTILVFILRSLLPKNISVFYLNNSGFPDPNFSFSFIRLKWAIYSKINSLILYLAPQRNIFLIINPPLISKQINNKNIYLPLPHHDYDLYKKTIENKTNSFSEKNIVFIDEMFTDHPDIKLFPLNGIENQEDAYYSEVNKFLDYISKKFDKKVIIARHPKHPYDLAKKRYKFKVSKKKTIEEIAKAFCVISHTSNSINMAIIMYKPIILLQTSAHRFSRLHIETLKELSKELSLPIRKTYTLNKINILRKDILKIKRSKYNNYIKNYITNSLNSPTTCNLINQYLQSY